MVGDTEAIGKAIAALKESGVGLKIMEGLQDFSTCKVRFSMNKKQA